MYGRLPVPRYLFIFAPPKSTSIRINQSRQNNTLVTMMIKQSTLFQWIFLSIMALRAAAFVVNPPLARCTLFSQRHFASVTGTAYSSEDADAPVVKLFTKEGCTLCDKAKDVLKGIQEEYPHSLERVDITDAGHEEWFSKYKYDIPVLHVNNQYWIKHRIEKEEAKSGLTMAREGKFSKRDGEPDAGAIERRQAEREKLGK
jgi:thiol-disulfide isomerase/thioredoxin